ncbi:MAG: helix-turn-helix domain-containing protein [Paracoccaceae bacterium]
MLNTVARNIEERRARLDMSMAELSRKSGLGGTGIFDILSGKVTSPKVQTIEKIARALQCDVTELLADHQVAEAEQAILDAFRRLPQNDQYRLIQTAIAWLQTDGRSDR